jgi:transposase
MMQKIPKQVYTAEFKEQAVRRVRDSKRVSAVAKDMGLVKQTLRNWVKAFEACKLNGAGAPKVTPEGMELSSLRAENARLKREVAILKKRRRTSRAMHCEVRLDRCAARPLRPERAVGCPRRQCRRLPGLGIVAARRIAGG